MGQTILREHVSLHRLDIPGLNHAGLLFRDPEVFPCRYRPGRHVGVSDKLLLDIAVGGAEVVEGRVRLRLKGLNIQLVEVVKIVEVFLLSRYLRGLPRRLLIDR